MVDFYSHIYLFLWCCGLEAYTYTCIFRDKKTKYQANKLCRQPQELKGIKEMRDLLNQQAILAEACSRSFAADIVTTFLNFIAAEEMLWKNGCLDEMREQLISLLQDASPCSVLKLASCTSHEYYSRRRYARPDHRHVCYRSCSCSHFVQLNLRIVSARS